MSREKAKRCWELSLTGMVSLAAIGFLFLLQQPSPAQKGKLKKYGIGVNIGKRLLPDDNPWNLDISKAPVDANSARLVAGIGLDRPLHPDFGTFLDGAPNGIPYVVVPGNQPKVPIKFFYANESDPGPYPIPSNAPIEGGPKSKGDRHILVLDRDNWMLYEAFDAHPLLRGDWKAGSGAIFNLKSNKQRPKGWTSADAAGLPILPGLVRYEEVQAGAIRHALRFTVEKSRQAYVFPATHFASQHKDPNLPPMGMRVRLRANFDMSGYPSECKVILTALQKYGMMLADNGGAWFLSGAPDSRWSDDNLHELKKVKGRDFEVVKMGRIITE
jgi:hypothetical protein